MDEEINTPDHPVWDNTLVVNLLFLVPTVAPFWAIVRPLALIDGLPLAPSIVGAGLAVGLALVFTVSGISFGATVVLSVVTLLGLCLEIAVSVAFGSSVWNLIVEIGQAIIGMGLLVGLIAWYILGKPLMSDIEFILGHSEVTAACVLALALLCVVAILYTNWTTGSPVVTGLVARMVTSLVFLSVLALVFLTALWHIVHAPIRFLHSLGESDPMSPNAIMLTTGILLAFITVELNQLRTADREPDATPVTAEEYPSVHAITTSVATQLDVPKPTIAVTRRTTPEAITVGYRPGSITLILSEGLLTALSEEELKAVIAHELTHVANVDAIVMTVASLPAFLADSVVRKSTTDLFADKEGELDFAEQTISNVWNSGPGAIFRFLLTLVAVLSKYASRPVVAILSRSRELAADRTAVQVTGSPAALASALRTLDERIDGTPDTDLRELSNLSALSILSLDPTDEWHLVGTHPPTEHRIAALSALTTEQEQ